MSMDTRAQYSAIRNAFYLQAGIGISANALLLGLHIALFTAGPKPRLTDLPVTHLALTHILMLLTMALLVSSDIWGAQDVPGDFKCKVLVFLHKVTWGLSMCTTSFLTVLQATIISPRESCLAHFKVKSTDKIVWIFFSLWFLTMFSSSNLLLYTVATPNQTQPGLLFINDHCSFLSMSCTHRGFFLTLMVLRDVIFTGLMVLSSGYMVVLLRRHKQRSLHLHGSSLSPRSSPEQRATHTILLLVSCFAALYCADFTLSLVMNMTWRNDPVLVGLQMLVAHGYGTVSPLVLISADTHVIRVLQTIVGTTVSFWQS